MLKDAFGFALIVATALTLWAVTPAHAEDDTSMMDSAARSAQEAADRSREAARYSECVTSHRSAYGCIQGGDW